MATKSNVQLVRKVRPKKPKINKNTQKTKKHKIENFIDIQKAVERGDLIRGHTSYSKQYISRNLEPKDYPIEPYKGRFGTGYKVYQPNWDSSTYCLVTYYLKRD